MSQVVHTVCETQAFHLSSQTRSPAYERQREPWASAPAPPSGIPPASLRQLRNRPKRESRTSTCKQPSSCIKSTHLPESSVKHTVWTTASQSSFLVPVGQEISLLTDTYREIRMSGYLKKSLKKNTVMRSILLPCSWPHRWPLWQTMEEGENRFCSKHRWPLFLCVSQSGWSWMQTLCHPEETHKSNFVRIWIPVGYRDLVIVLYTLCCQYGSWSKRLVAPHRPFEVYCWHCNHTLLRIPQWWYTHPSHLEDNQALACSKSFLAFFI